MSSRRRNRRSRSRSQSLSAELNWLLLYGDTMDPKASFSDEETREAWFRHRDTLMRTSPPGPTPWGFIHFESDRFESLAEIRGMRLELAGLQDVRGEFMCLASFHRHQGRLELADKFERLRANLSAVIQELDQKPNIEEEGAKR